MSHLSGIPGSTLVNLPTTFDLLGLTLVGGVALIWIIVRWIGWLDVLEDRRIERRQRMRRETP